MRIAVIGSGIAGLGAAWALSRAHEVTVFEAANRPGGHANTVEVDRDGGRTAVDTGFLVYNRRTYPHLVRLFEALDVPTQPAEMSFSVSIADGRLEYAGHLGGLFAQPRNLLRPGHWRMLRQVLRFYRTAPRLLELERNDPRAAQSLGAYLAAEGYDRSFVDDHLLPMAAAIWSCPAERMLAFPAVSFVRFLDNHGLLLLRGRPQWRSVTGGSRTYVRRLIRPFAERLHLATPVRALTRDAGGVTLATDGGPARFDRVVVATHANQALALLGSDADPAERTMLGAFPYQANTAVLHADPALMPRRRAVWASWNYLGDGNRDSSASVSVSYWLNRLQSLPGSDLFVSLNLLRTPAPSQVHARLRYDHPVFDAGAIAAQARLPEIQGLRNTWYCGSYCGYGFHEDALESGLAVAAALGAPAPWAAATPNVSPAGEAARPLAQLDVEGAARIAAE